MFSHRFTLKLLGRVFGEPLRQLHEIEGACQFLQRLNFVVGDFPTEHDINAVCHEFNLERAGAQKARRTLAEVRQGFQ